MNKSLAQPRPSIGRKKPRLMGQHMHLMIRLGDRVRGEGNLAERQLFFLSVALLAQADETREFGPASDHSSDGAALHYATAY